MVYAAKLHFSRGTCKILCHFSRGTCKDFCHFSWLTFATFSFLFIGSIYKKTKSNPKIALCSMMRLIGVRSCTTKNNMT